MTLYAGSSGFSFQSWKPGFYPADAKPEDFLRVYSERLPAVELNNTFYRLPAEGQFERWAATTPDGFRFAVKAPRSISMWDRVEDAGTFSERVGALGNRLGPVLVRVHDTRPRDDGFLRLLLDSLDPELAVALDLRDPSWDGVEETLGEWNAVRVNALESHTGFRYLRLRQPPYDEAALAGWASRVGELLEQGLDVYVFFRHEDEPTAPLYAERLLALVESK